MNGLIPPPEPPPYTFPHPPWTVGVVLVLGAATLFLGIAGDPLWLLVGSPFIVTLGLWIAVRLTQRLRGNTAPPDSGSQPR